MKTYTLLSRLGLLVAASLVLAGCGRNFYMSESEAGVYQSVLRLPVNANSLFSDLFDPYNRHTQQIVLQFDSSGPVPRVSQTNLLETIRALQNIAAMEHNGWIRLDRLDTQLDQQFTSWANDRLALLVDQGGSSIKLESLDRVTITFLSSPTFSYDSNHQSINCDTRVLVGIRGTLNVNVLSGFLSTLCGRFNPFCSSNPNGRYPLSIGVDLRLNVQFHLLNPYSDATSVQIHITPAPGNVDITRTDSQAMNSDVANGIRQLITQQLSPVDERIVLAYDNFTLASLRLSPTHSELGASYLSLPRNAEPVLDVVGRGEDGKLYHTRKISGQWGTSAALPFTSLHPSTHIQTDPALAASGPDRLDLVVIEDKPTTGNLLYAAWRDGAWSVARTSVIGAQQKPALVATAPGQLEVILTGTNGQLWHVRRLNGQWLDPHQIEMKAPAPQPPLRDPVAVQSENRIVLLFVDSRGLLYAMAFYLDGGVWGQPFLLTQDSVSFAPAVASCGDGRIDVVYAGNGQHPFHVALNAGSVTSPYISVGNRTAIDGTLSASPALTCSGFQRLELIGRGTDNVLYHRHFVGPADSSGLINGRHIHSGWQDWEQLTDRFFGTAFSGEMGPSVAIASTRTGQVHFVTLQNGAGAHPLLHNTYDSSLFGHAPWVAVNWRGFQGAGSINVVGAPALAVSDRQLELGLAAANGGMQLSRVTGTTDAAQSEGLATSPTWPVVISAGPGALDVLSIGGAGELVDDRVRNGNVSAAFPPSANLRILKQAAVSGGMGQIDVIGLGDDHSMYHWRFLRGQWQAPVLIPFYFTQTFYPPIRNRPPRTFLPPTTPAFSFVAASFFAQRPKPVPQPLPRPETRTVKGVILSAPILVATGAGQLELLAIGGEPVTEGSSLVNDPHLYRWRFVNGAWADAQKIESNFTPSATYFGQQAASSWGDGTVDVIVVEDSTGKMFHTRLLSAPVLADNVIILPGTTPGPPTPVFREIGGSTMDTPVLTALTADHLGLFALGTDQYAYENWAALPPPSTGGRFDRIRIWSPVDYALGLYLQWSGFRPLTATPVVLGGVARLGARELAMLAADPNGRVYQNRLVGSRWLGFAPLAGQPPQPRRTPSFTPVITVH